MALRRLVSVFCAGTPRLAPLSTAPAAREQTAAGREAVPGCGASVAARPPVPVVDFGNTQEAYRSRRSWELVRGLLVLRLCASPALLAHHEQLLHLTRRLLGQRLFEKLMKMTFYGQFVAGEDQESIRPLIRHNRAFGVGSILDYGVEEDLSPEEAERKEMDTLDLLDWSSLIDSRTELSKHLVVPNMQTGQLEPLLSRFTEEEELQMTRMLQRMDILAKKATEMGVRLMVDAEQTYFQPAISRLTLEMQRKFNVGKPLIFNTYQCYLKDAYDNITLDVELARREGWCFGAKLVRGAYMAQERTRAAEIGYEDPINPTYEATNAMYHRCLNYVLEELKHNTKAKVMVASHNEDTVRFTLRRPVLWSKTLVESIQVRYRTKDGGAGLVPCRSPGVLWTATGHVRPDQLPTRPGRLSRVQVCALWPCDGGAALPVPPCPGEQWRCEGRLAGATAAAAGAQAEAPHRQPFPPSSLVFVGYHRHPPSDSASSPCLVGLCVAPGPVHSYSPTPASRGFTFLCP
ncbi:proline dehydrogenase 1, mitochondrial isoform X6 [Halichoerus grypus]